MRIIAMSRFKIFRTTFSLVPRQKGPLREPAAFSCYCRLGVGRQASGVGRVTRRPTSKKFSGGFGQAGDAFAQALDGGGVADADMVIVAESVARDHGDVGMIEKIVRE